MISRAPSLPAAALLRRNLLRWYDSHRRNLPWRRTRDPYRIWISEVMLQQTRVQAVLPYYRRFLRHFPDVRALATAPQEQLLACWSGLGYYSRARNLQKAAQILLRHHRGRFPADLPAALALPGVGRYTASAVLSIAYDLPVPVVDGNVARVLARVFALSADTRRAAGKARLEQLAASLLSRRRSGDFNQSLMELGAMVCLPQQPRCASCPIRRSCAAYTRGRVQSFPRVQPRPAPVLRNLVAVIVRNRAGAYLLVRRPPHAARLASFWELPMWEVPAGNGLAPHGPHGKAGFILRKRVGAVRHTITNSRMHVEIFTASLRSGSTVAGSQWVARRRLASCPVTTLTRKALAL
jgi:A/G-specific adenine glycosylase